MEPKSFWQSPRFWFGLVAIVILLITLYFYDPFTTYLAAGVPKIRFGNIVLWFASLIGVVGFAISHWQAFRRNIFQAQGPANVEGLVFDSLQISLMTAVIFSAGAALQAVVMLGEYLLERGPIIHRDFGSIVLAIFLLLILTVVFYLLHLLFRALRRGWSPRSRPPSSPVRRAPPAAPNP
ncbi:MAG: hypothetical protein O7D96_11965 [SAR324 cluster bacterium]|nr:hypothetical protein [SAR324 cluster bacterium]